MLKTDSNLRSKVLALVQVFKAESVMSDELKKGDFNIQRDREMEKENWCCCCVLDCSQVCLTQKDYQKHRKSAKLP